ncbi:hypothetical protein [Kiloniella majae]|uniref:hypothetical protein n=1 Tax=Kiloniella majae TaxID=1938558 RepID=UPI000A2793C0|nr:hypothetical protein [Kiloniella majae]
MKNSGKSPDTFKNSVEDSEENSIKNSGQNTHSAHNIEIEEEFSTPLHYSFDNPPIQKPPRVECYLDQENNIRHMIYIGVIHHDQLVREVVEIWHKIGHLDRYDNLIDLRFHKGDVGWHTVREIGRQWDLYFKGDAPRIRTAFISRHITFNLLIKAMQALAPEHTFQSFKTKQAGLDWLKESK